MRPPPRAGIFRFASPSPHATHCAAAYAMKLRRSRVSRLRVGDGHSKGDFYEGLNAAGLEAAPFTRDRQTVAISVPRANRVGADAGQKRSRASRAYR